MVPPSERLSCLAACEVPGVHARAGERAHFLHEVAGGRFELVDAKPTQGRLSGTKGPYCPMLLWILL